MAKRGIRKRRAQKQFMDLQSFFVSDHTGKVLWKFGTANRNGTFTKLIPQSDEVAKSSETKKGLSCTPLSLAPGLREDSM